jgi:hypothetical protein
VVHVWWYMSAHREVVCLVRHFYCDRLWHRSKFLMHFPVTSQQLQENRLFSALVRVGVRVRVKRERCPYVFINGRSRTDYII